MEFDFKTIDKAGNLRGKRVVLAIDLNVPIQDGKVIDDYRIARSRKTLDFLKNSGARTILISHRSDEDASLSPVFEYLGKSYKVVFAETLDKAREASERAEEGSFILLENIRKIASEKEKKNEDRFAKELASLGDVYVNEAFSISHRGHASIVGVPKYLPSYAGFLLAEEVNELSKVFNPPKPFLFLLAGAKFETKLPLVNKFLSNANSVFIGGALANDLFKQKGYEVGKSRCSDGAFDFSMIVSSPKLVLPVDVVVDGPDGRQIKSAQDVTKEESIFDAGPETIEELKKQFQEAKFILWNGTLGTYEHGFPEGSEMLARAIALSGVESIVGGGDTLACISKLNLLDKFSFVSTGGGAMLDFLANETLPGIEALKNKL